MNTNKIIYWIATVLMCLLFLFSAQMYFFNYDTISEYFPTLGFPSWLVYPLAIAKVLGVVAILSRKSNLLKEWAYAGFFFDAVLALSAHLVAGDGGHWTSLVGVILVVLSRVFDHRVFTRSDSPKYPS